MPPKDLKVLRLLIANPRGLYASELVALSDGFLGRGTIYTLLDRMVEKGLVREVEEEATPALNIGRTRHFISGEGQKAFNNFLNEMQLTTITGSFAKENFA